MIGADPNVPNTFPDIVLPALGDLRDIDKVNLLFGIPRCKNCVIKAFLKSVFRDPFAFVRLGATVVLEATVVHAQDRSGVTIKFE